MLMRPCRACHLWFKVSHVIWLDVGVDASSFSTTHSKHGLVCVHAAPQWRRQMCSVYNGGLQAAAPGGSEDPTRSQKTRGRTAPCIMSRTLNKKEVPNTNTFKAPLLACQSCAQRKRQKPGAVWLQEGSSRQAGSPKDHFQHF